MNPNQTSKNKNPLLSCAITGGFEEFTGSGIVLTAAEKPVFTIGTSVISDTDNFSDISLDRDGTSESTTTTAEPAAFYSPLAELDSMGNIQGPPPTLDLTDNQQPQQDANLNPISAALAQLPNAASTVFSTFSNIIKGSSSQDQLQASVEPQPSQQSPVTPYGYISTNPDPMAPPPSFFSPTDDSLFKKQTVESTTNNTFRLGGNKKKTYAHIPGLSNNSIQQSSPQQNQFNPNPMMPPLPPQPVPPAEPANYFDNTQVHQEINNIYSYQQQQQPAAPPMQQQQKEVEKSSKFSLTSFLPSQLLEKIPSTKNIFGLNENNNFDQQSVGSQEFSVTTTANFDQQPQSTADFFSTQTSSSPSPYSNIVDARSQQQTPPANFFNPNQFNTNPFAQQQSTSIPPQAGLTQTPVTSFNNPTPSPQPSNNPPPTIDAISADSNCTPPTFFNPMQASELFKTSQVDDGKPKNPYSSNRLSRGVGLYKTRSNVPTEMAGNQNVAMPPMPNVVPQNTSQWFQPSVTSTPPPIAEQFDQLPSQPTIPTMPPQMNVFQPQVVDLPPPPAQMLTASVDDFSRSSENSNSRPGSSQLNFNSSSPEQQKIPSRPPSIPPATAALNFGLSQENAVKESLATNPGMFFETTSNFNNFPESNLVQPGLKKSDLNVPETTSTTEIDSAMNFFEDPVVATQKSSATTMSFFQPTPTAPPLERKSSNTSSLNNYFNESAGQQVKDAFESVSQVSNQVVHNDTSNEISEDIDSMSANIGSTLSLFATSELDSTLTQRISSAQVDSLIPKYLETQPTVIPRTSSPLVTPTRTYRPVYRHWFYQNLYWHPFAMSDSLALDEALMSGKEVAITDGGRFEVNLKERKRSGIYWLSGANAIRRCSWFYKNPNGSEANLLPFDETTSDFMETEYEKAIVNNSWNHKLFIPNSNDFILIKDQATIEYHQLGEVLLVKRGVDEFVIDDGEEAAVDHLIISVSSFGDKVEESAADELRMKCMETIQHYYSEAFDCGQVGRVEVLPISLNSIDVLKMMESKNVIESAPGGNSELIKSSTYQDIMLKTAFYCNQEFYQNIMNHLAFSLNEIVTKFLHQNPEFKGEISLIATSFEALFLFDLLFNQETSPEFWKLKFNTSNFYAFGMPTNLLTVRNGERLRTNFTLKNCKKFLNIVHRLDPIAQRIEPLVKPEFATQPPESIENENADRIDFTIADGSSLESFSLKHYFTSELIILRLTNEIYGALKMDSGSL